MQRWGAIVLLVLFLPIVAWGQDSISSTPAPFKLKKWDLHGYIKDLQTISFPDKANNILTDNLVHNRLNFKGYPLPWLTFDLEARTRIYYGTIVQQTTGFGTQLDTNSNDIYKMSVLVLNKPALVIHTMLDRAFVDINKGKWQFRLGRQRINWGVNLVWNPNDIFNAYSFYDFDYEERPGSDAARLVYYYGTSASIEVAGKIAKRKDQVVAAALWKFNKRNYDFQFLGGVAHQDVVLGGAWAGNIGNAGFKGEYSYFHPYTHPFDTVGTFTGSLSVDYDFPHNLYVNLSFLYNSKGHLNATLADIANTTSTLSAKTLSPYNYSIFTEVTYPFTPLFNGTLAVIYSPAGDNALFINPGLTYSIKENWDIDLISQLFVASILGSDYKFQSKQVYIRLKWSF